MQASSSQAAATTLDPLQGSSKERKPRHGLKKGKGREDGLKPSTHVESAGHSASALGKGSIVEESSTWSWGLLADSSMSNRPPVFTNDYRYFFLIAGSSVKIYATTTGQVVSTLSCASSGSASSSSQVADGHTDDITAAFVNPRNAFQLMTASLDGRVKIWDYLEASLLSTIEVGEPITHMCAHEQMPDHVFVATSSRKQHTRHDFAKVAKEQSKVYRISLRPSKTTAASSIHKPADILKVGKMRTTTGLAVSPSGAWLVATGGPKAYVCSTASLGSGFTKFVSNEILTCLAFHPLEEYFATGDQKGQIRLWYCLNAVQMTSRSQGEKRALTTTLHWHAHAVSSIAFTGNGSYLLSGGEEAVLVIWQLHTGKREFVPRVGAPIISIAAASHQSMEEEYLLLLSDGTISFVGSGTLRLSRSFSRIKHDPNYWSSGPAPLAVHTRSSTVILPSSHPSSLLLYAPLTSALLAELEVSPSNRVSRRDEKPIEPSRVDLVAASHDGQWLATIDGRDGGTDFERETYMKIWQWDSTSSTWILNSRIDRPHGTHRVHALTFAPAREQLLLVSTGGDGNVKMWRTATSYNNKGEQEDVFWVCRSTMVYRSKIPTVAICSPDGSLLAVANEGHVVIYELSNNVLRAVLACPELKKVLHVTFIGKSGQYIVAADDRTVILWDLVTTDVRWQCMLPCSICHVISHPRDDAFVVMYSHEQSPLTALRKFSVSSANPICFRTLPFKLRTVVWNPYLASGTDFTLVGITQKWSSVMLGDRITLPQEEGSSARGISGGANSYRRNLFQDIFGVSAFHNVPSQLPPMSSSMLDAATGPVKSSNPLDGPAYLLPPLHTLFNPLVDSLLRKRDTHPPQTKEEDEQVEEEDEIMDTTQLLSASEGRVLLDGDMDEFVELFKQPTFSSVLNSIPVTKSTNLNGNGIVKVMNGNHHHTISHSATSTPGFMNGICHPSQRPGGQESSPTIVGKKRKKSMA